MSPGAAPRDTRDALGRPLRDLRISVTDRCNFRCPYCMPAEVYGERYRFLPREEILSFEEIERVARLFAELGATKLRLTGGEPLLRAELPALVERLARIPGVEDLALTTNAYRLAGMAQSLRDAGLQRVTVSLDSHDESVFRRTTGQSHGPGRVLEGIEAAERAGLRPIKINCVVQRGVNDAGLVDFAKRFRWSGRVVRFIEFMDVGTKNGWELSRVVPADEILERIDAELPLEALPPRYPGEVADRYRYRDGGGEIGVVASVSRPFCGGCTRARLSAEGELVTCLFATGGTDLKRSLRAGASDEEIRALVQGIWAERRDRYSEERFAETPHPDPHPERIEMFRIGG